MRVDLGLQGIKFQNPLIALILLDLAKEPPDPTGHGDYPLGELPCLVGAPDGQSDF